MKKSELFEAWKLNQWFYSFWLFVCLMCILNKHFYHSYLQKVKKIQKKKQDQPAPARIFCHKYYEQMMRFTMTLQFTVLESFQRITLKMRIQRDVVFFSNTSTHDGHWKGWMVHIKYHEEVEGQQKKTTGTHGKRWDMKCLLKSPAVANGKTGNFGKTHAEVDGCHLWSIALPPFSVGQKSGTKSATWWDFSIRVSNGILWLQDVDLYPYGWTFNRVWKDATVWGWSLNGGWIATFKKTLVILDHFSIQGVPIRNISSNNGIYPINAQYIRHYKVYIGLIIVGLIIILGW